MTAGWSVTVSGVSFGYANATASAGVGASGCATAAWVSTTSVACAAGEGSGVGAAVAVSVAGVVGTRTRAFSYDAPVVSFADSANAATTAAWSVTVSGLNFGAADISMTVRLGATTCASASWASTTSVVCFAAAGEGASKGIVASVDGVAGTRTAAFSFDGGWAALRAGGLACLRSSRAVS